MKRKSGPKQATHPSVGEKCPACGVAFKAGDYTTLVPLGPGGDPESQKLCRDGKPYNAVATEVHWDCADWEDEA